MHCPLTGIQADFEINRPVRYRNTAKITYFHRRQTDRRTDGQTDIGCFSRKEKNTKNNLVVSHTKFHKKKSETIRFNESVYL